MDPYRERRDVPGKDPSILLPQFNRLHQQLQLANIHPSNIPALAESLMWARLLYETTGDDSIYRYVETCLLASRGARGVGADQVLAALTAQRDARSADFTGIGPRAQRSLEEAMRDSVREGVAEASRPLHEEPRERRGFGLGRR